MAGGKEMLNVDAIFASKVASLVIRMGWGRFYWAVPVHSCSIYLYTEITPGSRAEREKVLF